MFGFEIPAWALGVGFIILAGSLGRAIKRLAFGDSRPIGRFPGGKASRREMGQKVVDLEDRVADMDDLRSRLGELEDVQRRLGELEERVDFAERLLTKQREAERLVPPKS